MTQKRVGLLKKKTTTKAFQYHLVQKLHISPLKCKTEYTAMQGPTMWRTSFIV